MIETVAVASPSINVKTMVRGLLKELPDSCSLEDVMLELYARASIMQSREQIKAGMGMPLQTAKQEIETWLKSQSLPKTITSTFTP